MCAECIGAGCCTFVCRRPTQPAAGQRRCTATLAHPSARSPGRVYSFLCDAYARIKGTATDTRLVHPDASMRASTRASSSSGSMAPDPLRLVAVDPCRYATRRSAAAAARHSAPAAQRAPTCVQPPAHGTPRARHKHGCAAASTRPPAPRRAARGVNFGARATRRRCSTPGSPWAPRCRCRRAPRARSAWTRPSRGPRASTRRARTSTRASCASSSSAASWCVQGWHPHLLARQQATQSATPPSAACEARQTPRRACKHPSSFSFALPPTHCLRRQLQVRVQHLTSATPLPLHCLFFSSCASPARRRSTRASRRTTPTSAMLRTRWRSAQSACCATRRSTAARAAGRAFALSASCKSSPGTRRQVRARSERVYGSTVARRVHWEEETSVSAQAERAGVGEDDGVPGTKQKKQLVS